MTVPASPHFTPVRLDRALNASRVDLPERLRTPSVYARCLGSQTIRGMPFAFGDADGANVVLLDGDPVAIDLGGARATYVLFVHAVEDEPTDYPGNVAVGEYDGNGLGQLVSEYELEHADGSTTSVPILRRFAIQQAGYAWGSAPFACVPAAEDRVFASAHEAQLLERLPVDPRELAGGDRGLPASEWTADLLGIRQMRVESGHGGPLAVRDGRLWIYALANPWPDVPLRGVTCRPRQARSALYAVTLTDVVDHPLRPGVRRKLRVQLPDGMELNNAGEADEIAIDLGTVISARAALDYDAASWASTQPDVQPHASTREVIVEYVAHPQARLYVGGTTYELNKPADGIATIAPANRPVRLRFVDRGSRAGVAVRLHLHGEAGEYLPPRGHHRKVNQIWSQDHAAELVNVANQYCYVDGECLVDLPLGTVYVDITRGYEIAPVRTSVEVGPETDELVFELDKVLRWRERGWVTADTHVHFLSPQTALLEGRAEGVNVVNLLASQWGELFSSVGDFDGKTTYGAEEFGGDGEFLVRVGSENRTSTLGHISLLGYSGELIQPLCTGGPDEAAFGDPLEVTNAEWAQRCIDQGGIVVLPHSPVPQLERAANIVLGLVHAIELMSGNPLHPTVDRPNAHGVAGIADWYRYLNLGYHIPLVGGSDKMSAAMPLGGMRTYAQLGERELTYESWMDALRAGNTFATIGPLASIRVEGAQPGSTVALPSSGGTLEVEWDVESVRLPIERVEVVTGGLVSDELNVGGELSACGRTVVPVTRSTWIALRVRGSYRGNADDIAAHTSAVRVLVEGSELFSEVDSMTVLEQIQGALAYVDTIAPRPELRRLQALRATLEAAYNRLHQRMHAAGIYHRHPLHDPAQPHEH